MPIPTAFDARLGTISDAASGVLVALTTMRHANPADIQRLRQALRERLKAYVDEVMSVADDEGAQ
jgi:hypothetical protein